MKRKIDRGQPLTELVKGSYDYTMRIIGDAFHAQFPNDFDRDSYYWINEIFDGYLIISADAQSLAPDEFYLVTYERQGDAYVFASRDAWEVVELTYQPARTSEMPERQANSRKNGKGKPKRFTEHAAGVVIGLDEAKAEEPGKPRRLKAVGITADVVNGNGRRYPAAVLEAAVNELQGHLHESAGQGRAMLVLGEAEHPSDKLTRRPNLLETVVNWQDVSFDGRQVLIEGTVLETSKGRDILALMEGGVMPGVSQRGYGESTVVEEDGQEIEEVLELTITGYDLVLEPSDPEAAVTMLESDAEAKDEASQGDGEMKPEELMELIKANPDLFRGVVAEEVKTMSEAQRQALEAQIREALGIDEVADLGKALREAAEAKREVAESKRRQAVELAINDATKDLPYGNLNEAFVQAIRATDPQSPEAVKALVEAKRKEYDSIVSQARLAGMGFRGNGGVQVLGPVIEREAGVPAFARGAFEFQEALIKADYMKRRDLSKPVNHNELVAQQVLERFDAVYGGYLKREAKMLEEAELTTDLNIPYSASRAILAAVWPNLVATGVFDVGTTENAPTRIYYESYSGESGSSASVTDENVTFTALDTYAALTYKMVQPGTVVVNAVGPGALYVEGTDYVVDYFNGEIKALTGGSIGATDTVLVDYTYDAIRKGENAAIERGKLSLSHATLEIVANRLAQEISNEAVVFSRSQLGWDATTRTLNSLAQQLRRKIDKNLLYNGLTAALSVASNSGGSWTAATDPLIDLVSYIGVAKVKIANRFYEPTGVVLSTTNSDALGNWDGFTAAGKRPDVDLNVNGYVGRVKGLPVFASTEMSDSYALVLNRELVMYRIFQPMVFKGPYPSFSSNKLLANEQWYAEQYDGAETPIANKGSYVVIG